MSANASNQPVAEGAEASPDSPNAKAPATPEDIVLLDVNQAVPNEGTDLANTCCGVPLHAPHTAGPFLRFWGLEREAEPTAGAGSGAAGAAEVASLCSQPSVWKGSVLLVTRAPVGEVVVELQDASGAQQQVLNAEELDSFRGWRALRFRLRVPVAEGDTQVFYAVTVSGQVLRPSRAERFSFHVPGRNSAAHWGFYSCSGFTPDVPNEDRDAKWGGITPLWRDVMAVHKERPLHLLVGGGDQLYCDDVWSLPVLKTFLDMHNETDEQLEARCNLAFSDGMRDAVDTYYFHHYACHFAQEHIRDVYGLVPQVMSWDDHDIFDGWGSYPPYLQHSRVFQGIFKLALRWYCVFQQHCTPAEKPPVEVYEIGSRTAIVACDMRSQRCPDEIVPLEHYMSLSLLCTKLPKGIQHVVFVSTVPVVYPHVKGTRTVLGLLKNGVTQCLLGSLGAKQLNQFGEPELMDDLDDHWSAPDHREERRFLIENLQMLAKYRSCRVTLLSGDVHVAGAGQLVSHPPPPEAELRHDFRYMPQVISSAIGNAPPPSGLVRMLQCFGRGGRINKNTRHSMVSVLRNKLGAHVPLDNKRNWCEVTEHPADEGGSLTFSLRLEDTPGNVDAVKTFAIVVPPLEPLKAGTGAPEYYHGRHRRFGLKA